jgi:hypothetical protein
MSGQGNQLVRLIGTTKTSGSSGQVHLHSFSLMTPLFWPETRKSIELSLLTAPWLSRRIVSQKTDRWALDLKEWRVFVMAITVTRFKDSVPSRVFDEGVILKGLRSDTLHGSLESSVNEIRRNAALIESRDSFDWLLLAKQGHSSSQYSRRK